MKKKTRSRPAGARGRRRYQLVDPESKKQIKIGFQELQNRRVVLHISPTSTHPKCEHTPENSEAIQAWPCHLRNRILHAGFEWNSLIHEHKPRSKHRFFFQNELIFHRWDVDFFSEMRLRRDNPNNKKRFFNVFFCVFLSQILSLNKCGGTSVFWVVILTPWTLESACFRRAGIPKPRGEWHQDCLCRAPGVLLRAVGKTVSP